MPARCEEYGLQPKDDHCTSDNATFSSCLPDWVSHIRRKARAHHLVLDAKQALVKDPITPIDIAEVRHTQSQPPELDLNYLPTY